MKKLKKERHVLPSPTDIRVKDDFEEKKKEFIMKKSHGPLEGGVTNLERLAEIEKLFETQDDESLDVDRVMALLEELEADAPAPEMKLPIDSPAQRPKPRAVPRFVRPVASVAAALFICFAMSTTALGKSIINVIFDKNSEQIYIDGYQGTNPNAPAQALQDALYEADMGYVPLPWWLPEKYTLEDYEITHQEGLDALDAYYVSGDEYLDIHITFYSAEASWGTGIEKDIGGEEKNVGRTTCYLFTNMGTPVAYWNYGNAEVIMTGSLPLRELDTITDTIK